MAHFVHLELPKGLRVSDEIGLFCGFWNGRGALRQSKIRCESRKQRKCVGKFTKFRAQNQSLLQNRRGKVLVRCAPGSNDSSDTVQALDERLDSELLEVVKDSSPTLTLDETAALSTPAVSIIYCILPPFQVIMCVFTHSSSLTLAYLTAEIAFHIAQI